MHHEYAEPLLALLGAFSILTIFYAFTRLLRWRERRFWARMDAEYRAAALVQESKRYMDRIRAREHEVFYDPYD
ncbi:hypothetical protein [Xanthomonas translucens]|uniref:hypothetical protein n=1 Tax=Xanthomonas campestris pv. translucens TaxID=343 RepID=UPI000B319A0A|nr:hypothetical protein [Xanthomonas translucens]